MAKRFTDTDKWKRPWFAELEIKAKLAWIYLLDDCDHRGVWFVNFKRASFDLGFKVTESDFTSWFGDKLIKFENDKYLIKSFIDFQYGELQETNNAHKPILRLLEKLGPNEPLRSPSERAQDKDKDKDKDKDIKKGGVGENKITLDFEILYDAYPRKLKKGESIKRLARVIKTQEDYDLFDRANKNHAEYHARIGTKEQYIPHMTTFIENRDSKPYTQPWRDWLDPKTGTSTEKTTGDLSHLFAGIKDDAS